MNRLLFGILIIFTVLCSSCITNKDVVYLQDKGTVVSDSLQIVELSKPYRIQINDILSIKFKAIDSEVNKLLGIFQPVTVNNGASGVNKAGLYFNGFSVDLHGNIEFPILGKINVLGYTTDEIRIKIKEALFEKYLNNVSQVFITVKLAGLTYSVTGEGANGVYTLYQDRVNIIEALAKAGGMVNTADRTDVKIIRQYPQGQKIHSIDLTDLAALKSPYYYIQPNDIIMVKPLKRKAIGAGETATQTLRTVASIFSVIISTYFLVKNL